MSDAPEVPKPRIYSCTFCGERVTKDDFCYETRTYSCGDVACEKEQRETEREIHDRAQYEAELDGYERYR